MRPKQRWIIIPFLAAVVGAPFPVTAADDPVPPPGRIVDDPYDHRPLEDITPAERARVGRFTSDERVLGRSARAAG